MVYIGAYTEIINGASYDGFGFEMQSPDKTFIAAIALFWNLTGIYWRKKINGNWSDWTLA